ncbi:MAG TPA: GAF domain-containing protein, partial [Candidatus Tectomicrobia bacterium]|nr:GAF domain-containing protein [Candidatus Tectomicrobia bacterium]
VPTLGDWAEAYLASRDGAFRRIGPVCVDPAAAAAARAVREMQPPVTWASGPNPALDTQLEGRPLVLADVPDGWLERHLVGDEYIRLLRGAPPRSLMLAPLIARGRTIGSLLFVSTRGGRAYDDADVALALDLGRRAGAAIDSARLVVRAEAARADAEAATEESRRQAARLRMLLHLTHTISSSLDSRTVLSEVAGAAAELTGARLVSIWIADESSRTLRPVAFNDEQLGRSHPADTLRYGEGGIGWVAAHRKPLVVPDIDAERRFVARPWFRGQGLTSAMELPILFGDSLLGVIGFFGERPFEQRPEIREMLDGFLAQAALAMRNARMYEDALRRQERTAFLAEAGALLASSLEYERTLVDLTRLVVPRLADSCALDMVAGGAIRRLAVAHVDAAKEALVRELRERYGFNPDAPDGVPRVVRTGEPAFVPHVTDADLATAARTPEQLAILRSLGMRSWIIVPLVARERILGAITLVTADSGRTFDAADLELARDLARLAAIAIDNAELYRAAQEANRAKDEFLATLSHELRTPLNSVLGWARMLRAGQLAEAARARALEVIERNAMAQAELIEDLLDVSRIITGKLRLEVHSVDPAVAVRAALDVVSPSVDAKQIRLETALASDAGMILADPDRLRQVVLNLLANAVKFTASGGTIRVSLARVDDGVEIQVSDTGEGIEPGALPYIFDRFRQADSTTTRKHGGLGLGLALVRHLVDLHGGSVEARSEGAGKGATFVVRLPSPRGAVGASDVREADVAAVPPQGTPRLEGVRVLVVDDDTDSLELVRVVLRQAGAAVVTATSAAEALVALREARYEVVLTDVEMPGEDGYSFVRRLRATPGGARIPVVALTAYGRVEDRVRTKSAGFALHVAKPAQPEEIVAAVASVVDRGPARRVD